MKLKETRLFKNTEVDLTTIKIIEFPNKFTIASEGDISHKLGIVLEGKISVKSYSAGGKNLTFATLLPGNLFGDLLIYGKKEKTFPGILVTKGITKVAFIRHEEFEHLLFNDIVLLRNFLSLVSEKAYEMNMRSKLLSQDSIRNKILFWLQQMTLEQGSNIITLNMTKEELASILFTQRPSLSRELALMKEDGLIDYDRHTITLKK